MNLKNEFINYLKVLHQSKEVPSQRRNQLVMLPLQQNLPQLRALPLPQRLELLQ